MRWAMTSDDLSRLIRNDNWMVRWICSKKLSDRCTVSDLHSKLNIISLAETIRRGRLRWFGHLMRMDENLWQKKVLTYVVPGVAPRGHPKVRWMDNVKKDMKDLSIEADLTADRARWRQAIYDKK